MSGSKSNCDTCGHKETPQGGWCYMFRVEPTETCMIHTEMLKCSKHERETLIMQRDQWMKHAQGQADEVKHLMAALRSAHRENDTFRKHQENDVWYWQGDQEDHLESMSALVAESDVEGKIDLTETYTVLDKKETMTDPYIFPTASVIGHSHFPAVVQQALLLNLHPSVVR